MKSTTHLLTVLLLLICLSQSYGNLESIDNQNPQELKVGAITDTVFCQKKSEHFYSLFLPSNYQEDKNWPVIYFFEPVARAKLPLTLYQDIAEKYGLILACSYNSRNGPIKQNETAYTHLSLDVEERLSIDPGKIYLSGFSGGGRISQFLAQENSHIAGVISVAGPKVHDAILDISKFSAPYTGIVGNRDMNYLEHIRFQERLNEADIPNDLFTYDAAHQWPPKEVYQLAVQWHLALAEYSDGSSTPAIDNYLKERVNQIDTSTTLTLLDKHRSLEAIARNFKNTDRVEIGKKLVQIESDKSFKKLKKQEITILKTEEKDQLEFVNALSEFRNYYFQPGVNPDSSRFSKRWWKSEIGRLKTKAKQKDPKGLSSARKIDFLRGQLHNQVSKARTLNKRELILDMHSINLMLYPQSVWFHWQHAILLAQHGSKKEATAYLKLSKKINETQLNQIRQSPGFTPLRKKYPYLFI